MKLWIGIGVVVAALIGLFALGNKGGDSGTSNQSPGAGALSGMIGKPAPDFTLTDYNGKSVTLSQLKGKKVVLFFNEGVMCYPACWNQIAALGSDGKLNNDEVTTLSIVPDSKDEWTEAVGKMPELGKEQILMDSANGVSASYGMLNLPSVMHKGSKPGHTYVILDKDGVVRWTYDDPKMGIQDAQLNAEVAKL